MMNTKHFKFVTCNLVRTDLLPSHITTDAKPMHNAKIISFSGDRPPFAYKELYDYQTMRNIIFADEYRFFFLLLNEVSAFSALFAGLQKACYWSDFCNLHSTLYSHMFLFPLIIYSVVAYASKVYYPLLPMVIQFFSMNHFAGNK